ncbi:hypothetical protein C8A03DRAFT_44651 [Achaetomium macrosporum]|uniref:ATP-grasp domain-containing protein n=1 Tax=Achaetomium macrosporum TaxID=79813 RepID=A0AAN7C8Z3_9PEZI|nr:hypothetical protein C8A03DRAFT_44651 [Achaetomium macrosporum]
MATTRVAVLFQQLDPPFIHGTQKPKKPNGYRDSGADIAYNLREVDGIDVIYSIPNPRPDNDVDWCFGDNEEDILQALEQGATHLWANTILFAAHPLQTSVRLSAFQDKTFVVGQGPLAVEKYDDKDYVNSLLRRTGGFTMPRSWIMTARSLTIVGGEPRFPEPLLPLAKQLPYPVVVKPIRGRGSHGVRVCHNIDDLVQHAPTLFKESGPAMAIMVEEFLAGEEATITVMPPMPAAGKNDYWALPVVTRFNHVDGIAPYNGVVAVTQNSRAVTEAEMRHDPTYAQVMGECVRAARLLRVAAPIRIDVRRLTQSPGSKFALFDVNMKPNMTGPGRPGRDDQASLTLIAAAALGWDYKTLLSHILMTACPLGRLRGLKPVELDAGSLRVCA